MFQDKNIKSVENNNIKSNEKVEMFQKSILDLKLQHKNEIDKLQAEKEKDKRQSKQLKERIEHSNKVNFDKEKQQKEIAEDMKKKIKMLELKCAQKNDTEEKSSTIKIFLSTGLNRKKQ